MTKALVYFEDIEGRRVHINADLVVLVLPTHAGGSEVRLAGSPPIFLKDASDAVAGALNLRRNEH